MKSRPDFNNAFQGSEAADQVEAYRKINEAAAHLIKVLNAAVGKGEIIEDSISEFRAEVTDRVADLCGDLRVITLNESLNHHDQGYDWPALRPAQ